MRKIIITLALALSLGGCASLGSIGEKVLNLPAGVFTTTVANPVSPVNLYQAKVVYASTLELADGYREYCYSKPYAALRTDPVAGPVCRNRRKIIRAVWVADDKAAAALATADTFIKNNPTLDATSAIRAAISAVTNFQNVAASTAKTIAK